MHRFICLSFLFFWFFFFGSSGMEEIGEQVMSVWGGKRLFVKSNTAATSAVAELLRAACSRIKIKLVDCSVGFGTGGACGR